MRPARLDEILPLNSAMVRPSPVGIRNESCFSAVDPVMGTNQWV